MTGIYATAVITSSLALAVWAVALVIVNRAPNAPLVIGAAVLEVMLIVFAVGGVVQMIQSDRDFARLEFVGYLLGVILIVPAAVRWMRDEKSRAASGVLAVVFLVMPILILRVQAVWAGTSV